MLDIICLKDRCCFAMQIAIRHSALCLVCLIYVLSASAFILDLQRANILAYGITYTPLIATAVLYRNRTGLWILTALAIVLVFIGGLFPVVDSDLPDVIGNRFLSVAAILATAMFIDYARRVQARLMRATRQAEAAERMTTEILTNLSHEIRPPLHSLLGMMALTQFQINPALREVFNRASHDGRQLLATIDNLIDLSRIDDHELQLQAVDMALVARQAVEQAARAAYARQITVAMATNSAVDFTLALGDPWAINRILDNFLANAIRMTPPGGTISVSVERERDMIRASVSDTAGGLPLALAPDNEHDAPIDDSRMAAETGGIGLALSSRLARSMQGQVVARNNPNQGATLILVLPAV